MKKYAFKQIRHLLEVCYQCGTCTASCAVGLVNAEKNIRSLIQKVINATDDSILDEDNLLWLCMTCYQCEDRCPQGIPLATLLVELKNIAAKKGWIPSSVQKEMQTIAEHGFTFPPVRSILLRREKLGLPDLPELDQDEIRTLINITDLQQETKTAPVVLAKRSDKENSKDKEKFALFFGCTIPYKLPHLEAASRFVMEKLGLEMVDLPFGCCPDPNGVHSYGSDIWFTLAARNLAIAEEQNLDIITFCNGCYATLNYSNYEMKKDSNLRKRVNENLRQVDRQFNGTTNVVHFYQYLHQNVGYERLQKLVVNPLTKLKIAVHYGCHSLRPRVMDPPEDPENPQWLWEFVANVLNAQPVRYLDETQCCGAGIREMNQEFSLMLTERKMDQIEDMEANAILVPCPTCYLQFDAGQRLILRGEQPKIKGTAVFYQAELLAIAMGAAPEAIGIKFHMTKPDRSLLQPGKKQPGLSSPS
jgi:heterodisulfide reductase subunit B